MVYLILFTALNIFLYSNADYIGLPKTTENLRVELKHKLVLKCKYTGEDGNGEFVGWYKDNDLINDTKKDHYLVENTEKVAKLTITLNVTDENVQEWSARTSKLNEEQPSKCKFNKITIRPSPQRMETNIETEKLDTNLTSIRRAKGDPITFKCILLPNSSIPRQITWKFSKDGETYGDLPAGVETIHYNEIFIKHVNNTHRGYYSCKLNRISFATLLRVKDQFAALWPFIGIVCTVVVLVIGILILEKRQKAAKKNAVVEDEVTDNATDPLVQSTKKSSDNQNQTVNA